MFFSIFSTHWHFTLYFCLISSHHFPYCGNYCTIFLSKYNSSWHNAMPWREKKVLHKRERKRDFCGFYQQISQWPWWVFARKNASFFLSSPWSSRNISRHIPTLKHWYRSRCWKTTQSKFFCRHTHQAHGYYHILYIPIPSSLCVPLNLHKS